jgi:hypothetical protein
MRDQFTVFTSMLDEARAPYSTEQMGVQVLGVVFQFDATGKLVSVLHAEEEDEDD